MKILIIDDVGYTRHYCTRLLQNSGYTVEAAASGSEAIRLLDQDHTFDVVLTDLLLKDMDGLDVFRAVQKKCGSSNGTSPPPAFLLMTALRPGQNPKASEPDKLEIAKELGFSEVFLKPIDVEHLLYTLARIEYFRTMSNDQDAAPFEIVKASKQLRRTIDRITESANRHAAIKLLEQIEPDLERLRSVAGIPVTRS